MARTLVGTIHNEIWDKVIKEWQVKKTNVKKRKKNRKKLTAGVNVKL